MNNDPPEAKPALSTESNSDPLWERELLSKLAFSALEEQRRARRWSIGFKFAFFGYLILLLVLYLPADALDFGATGRHTALVDIKGVIAADSDANADNIITGLRAAFADSATAGVILRINSPGGSPVQAGYVNDEITRLRGKYPNIPLYAVIVDVTASGGYYIAAAADKIYANKAEYCGLNWCGDERFWFCRDDEKSGCGTALVHCRQLERLTGSFFATT